MDHLIYILIGICVLLLLVNIIMTIVMTGKLNSRRNAELQENIEKSVRVFADLLSEQQKTAINMQDSRLAALADQQSAAMDVQDKRLAALADQQSTAMDVQDKRLAALADQQSTAMDVQDKRLAALAEQQSRIAMENEQKLENIRSTMEKRISAMTEENNKQLEKMRETVDEKLQKTLEDRLTQSFKLVSERLEEVYKGLGEMQTLASGVGDLKKVLSNVKTRGILGEIQLGAILSQIMSPDQYEENVTTKKGSSNRVEFAVKLPGEDEGTVYLPIDAKFPADTYSTLMDAYETGDRDVIKEAEKALVTRIKNEAKDIKDKYIYPPDTTDFAIMFLPVEGLYAEVIRLGLVDQLQREFKVNIAGPTTMAALLNSLQMGFRTLAIQKHSSEVWDVLSAVKTEFDTFGEALDTAQKRINQANDEIAKLIGTRSNAIRRKLRSVQSIPEQDARELLSLDDISPDI